MFGVLKVIVPRGAFYFLLTFIVLFVWIFICIVVLMKDEFNITFSEGWLNKDELLIQPEKVYENIFNNAYWYYKPINWFLRLIGFNVGYDILVVSEPKAVSEGYIYQVRPEYRVVSWLSYRLWKTKI